MDMRKKKKRNKSSFLVVILAIILFLLLLLKPLNVCSPTNSGVHTENTKETVEQLQEEPEEVFIPNTQVDLGKVIQMEEVPFESQQQLETNQEYENIENDITPVETAVSVVVFGTIITEVIDIWNFLPLFGL